MLAISVMGSDEVLLTNMVELKRRLIVDSKKDMYVHTYVQINREHKMTQQMVCYYGKSEACTLHQVE